MDWISCRDKLPRRFKYVHVRAIDASFIARRSLMGCSWVMKSGLSAFISEYDYWR